MNPSNLTRLSPGRKFLVDGFTFAKRPGGCGIELIDMTGLVAVRGRLKGQGLNLTYTVLAMKVLALAVQKFPLMHSFLERYTLHHPETCDVGASVAGTTNFAPVAVVREVEHKNLAEIASEFEAAANARMDGEAEALRLLDKAGRVFFLRCVRRWLVRLSQNAYKFTRREIGTIQISNPGTAGVSMYVVNHIATSALLVMGTLEDRPMVKEGKLEIRPSIYITLHYDHRIADGLYACKFVKEVARLLENPQEWVPQSLPPGFSA